MLWWNFSSTLKLNAHPSTSFVHKRFLRSEGTVWWLNTRLFALPLAVPRVSTYMFTCMLCCHSLLNFLHPTVCTLSGLTPLSTFPYFCGFVCWGLAYLSRVPLWMALFLCISVWLQIAVLGLWCLRMEISTYVWRRCTMSPLPYVGAANFLNSLPAYSRLFLGPSCHLHHLHHWDFSPVSTNSNLVGCQHFSRVRLGQSKH